MAQRGRPPKPVEVHRRNGNPSKKDLPEAVVILPSANGIPALPENLGEVGRAAWPEIWRAAHVWLNPDLDGRQVELICRTYDELDALRNDLETHGQLLLEPIVTPKGPAIDPGTGEMLMRLVPNPAAKMIRAAEKQLQSWLQELGFTPTARARLGLAEVKRQSKLEELMAMRSGRAS